MRSMKRQKETNKTNTMLKLKKKKKGSMRVSNGQIQFDHLIKKRKFKKKIMKKLHKLFRKLKKMKIKQNRMNHTLKIWKKNIEKSNPLSKIMIKF